MRAALLTVVLLVPFAAAAGYDLGADRTAEGTLGTDAIAAFAIPLTARADGFLYAKLLDTPGNAAYANGSWSVSFALARPDGTRQEMGAFSNDKPSALAAVKDGEALTFLATAHAPPDAAREQRVYVALAFRNAATASPGATSGGTMDEAQALTLVVRSAGGLVVPTPDVQPIPSESTGALPAAVVTGDAPTPAWLVAAAAVATAALVGILATLVLILRELRAAREAAPREVPVRGREVDAAVPQRKP